MIALQEVDKLDGYKQTKVDPQKVVDLYKSRFLVVTLICKEVDISVACV